MVHTRDFSKAPAAAQGEALFFGGTEYTGPRALLGLVRVWLPVARRMRAAPGYRGHIVWYRFPFTFGTVSFWASREDLMAFGRSDEHRRAVAWLLRPGNARGAFIRFHAAEAAGHTIGGWRAEPDPDRAWRTARYPFSTPTTLGAGHVAGDACSAEPSVQPRTLRADPATTQPPQLWLLDRLLRR